MKTHNTNFFWLAVLNLLSKYTKQIIPSSKAKITSVLRKQKMMIIRDSFLGHKYSTATV